MLIDITYWDYSTHRKCDICEGKPADVGEIYWHLATIDGKQHCMCCLGNLVNKL